MVKSVQIPSHVNLQELCVGYLLEHYSPQSALEAPWLLLADPFYLEPTWKNSAFHAAAWSGHAEALGPNVVG